MAFTMDYIIKVRHYAFVSECGYMYRIDNMQSLTKKDARPNYEQQKAQYSHCYNSITNYIRLHNLNDEQSLKRRKQCARIFRSLIQSMYYGENGRQARIEALNSWPLIHYEQLSLISASPQRHKLLLAGSFSRFDFYEYIIRLPYRIRYTSVWPIILRIKQLLRL